MRSLGSAIRLLAVASVLGASTVQAQGVGVGYSDIGVVVGLGGINGASFSFGGRWENIIKPLPDLGDGVLGLQVGVDWYSWDYAYLGGNSGITYIPIGVTANYHFKMENKKIDPFLGAGLGYQIVNASCVYNGIDYCGNAYSSAIYFITKAGIRYFYSPSMTLYADVGVGAATLNAGLMFRLKGAK